MRMILVNSYSSCLSSSAISSSVQVGSTPQITTDNKGDFRGGGGCLVRADDRLVSLANVPKISKLNLFHMVVARLGSGDLTMIPLRVGMSCEIDGLGSYLRNRFRRCLRF